MSLIVREFVPPATSYFLFGPRGVGKSTFIHTHYPDCLMVDLLKPQVLREYMIRPEKLYELIAGHPEKNIIVIDEVQKAPQLLSIVHDVMERDKSRTFILTGSSSRKLKKTSANLLGGRAIKRSLHPFMASELAGQFDLERALSFGAIPLIVESSDPQEQLHAYIQLYMQEEIQAEGLVRSLESFGRFLEAVSFSHACEINISNISRSCAVKRKTVENYLAILEDLLLGFRLPVFVHQASRDLTQHPKFYLFDAGVFQTMRPKLFGDGPATYLGPALEGLVATHLRSWCDYSKAQVSLYFWRTRTGLEVDFVIYGPGHFYAIEVKNHDRFMPEDVKPLNAFLSDYPMATAILLYRGKERLKRGHVWILPIDEWLLSLKPNGDLI